MEFHISAILPPGKQPSIHWTGNGGTTGPLQLLWRKVTCLCHELMTMLPQLSNCSYCSHVCFTQSVYKLKQSYKNRNFLISSTNPIRKNEISGNTTTNKFTACLSPTIISMGKQWLKLSCSRVLESPACKHTRARAHTHKVKLFFSKLIRWDHKHEVIIMCIRRLKMDQWTFNTTINNFP